MSEKSEEVKKMVAPRGMPSDRVEVAANAPLVLVVEDDPDAAMVAQGMLNLLGYRSSVAPDAHDALHFLHESRPALILLDVNLPTMDGLSLLRIARKLKGVAGIPVVGASAVYADEGPIARAMRAEGVRSFLDKPFTLNSLREAIDFALAANLDRAKPPSDSGSFVLPGRSKAAPTWEIDQKSLANIPSMSEADRLREPEPLAPRVPSKLSAPKVPSKSSAPKVPSKSSAPEVQSAPRAAKVAEAASSPPAPRQEPPRTPSRDSDTVTDQGMRSVGESDLRDGRPERSVTRTVSGTATDASGGWPVQLERCSAKEARFVGGHQFGLNEQLRLQFTFRAPVNDAMTDLTVRMLARTRACLPKAGGTFAVEVLLLGMGPQDAFACLMDILRDT